MEFRSSRKRGGRMGHGPRKILLHFVLDPGKGVDPEMFYLPGILRRLLPISVYNCAADPFLLDCFLHHLNI